MATKTAPKNVVSDLDQLLNKSVAPVVAPVVVETPVVAAPETVVDVNVDTEFVKVYAEIKDAEGMLGGKWASVAQYAIEHKLTRDIILASIKSTGAKYETAQSNTSRILDLMKPENAWKLEKLSAGLMSVRQARDTKLTQESVKYDAKGHAISPALTPRSKSERLNDALLKASGIALSEGLTLEDFIEKCEEVFESTQTIKISKASKASKASAPVLEPATVAGN